MDAELDEDRTQLVDAEQRTQEDYDKASLSLNGGALGVSIAFVKNIFPSGEVHSLSLLALAWLCWGVGVALILVSHYTANLSLRKAISQYDKGTSPTERLGGGFDVATVILNVAHGSLFIIGLLFMIVFALNNLEV